MDHATYQETDFPPYPLAERISSMSFLSTGRPCKHFTVGIKTITHNDHGIKLKSHKTAVFEIRQGDEMASFDLNASTIRIVGSRLLEYAELIEADKV